MFSWGFGAPGRACSLCGDELVDLVGTETRPVIRFSDDDGCLLVTECLDEIECCLVDRHVVGVVLDTLLVEFPVGCRALHARRLAVNSDPCHDGVPFDHM